MQLDALPSNGDKRRARTISLVVHALILLLGLIPFLVPDRSDDDILQAIAIQFADSPSARSGSSQAGRAGSEGAREQVAMANISASKPQQSVPTPQQREMVTSPTPDLQIPKPADNFFNEPLEVNEVAEVDNVQELPDEQPTESEYESFEINDVEESSDAPAPLSDEALESARGTGQNGDGEADDWYENIEGVAESGAEDPFADGFFSGEWPGDGRGTTGTTSGSGTDGENMRWGEFSDDGLFKRKVIQRANVARLAIKQGKMVITLCVDRRGQVVFTKFDQAKSTLSDDPDLIARAEQCAEGYIFEPDPSAPEQQCGKLTFIFQIEK